MRWFESICRDGTLFLLNAIEVLDPVKCYRREVDLEKCYWSEVGRVNLQAWELVPAKCYSVGSSEVLQNCWIQ